MPFCSICRHISSRSVRGAPRICLSLMASIRSSIPAASNVLTAAPLTLETVGDSNDFESIHLRRPVLIGTAEAEPESTIFAGASDDSHLPVGLARCCPGAGPMWQSAPADVAPIFAQIAGVPV